MCLAERVDSRECSGEKEWKWTIVRLFAWSAAYRRNGRSYLLKFLERTSIFPTGSEQDSMWQVKIAALSKHCKMGSLTQNQTSPVKDVLCNFHPHFCKTPSKLQNAIKLT